MSDPEPFSDEWYRAQVHRALTVVAMISAYHNDADYGLSGANRDTAFAEVLHAILYDECNKADLVRREIASNKSMDEAMPKLFGPMMKGLTGKDVFPPKIEVAPLKCPNGPNGHNWLETNGLKICQACGATDRFGV